MDQIGGEEGERSNHKKLSVWWENKDWERKGDRSKHRDRERYVWSI